jgi:WD40 repeat protein
MKHTLFLLSVMLIGGCSLTQKKPSRTLKRDDWWLWTVSWHPNKDQVVVGGTQDTLRLFSTTNYQLLNNYLFEGTITKVKWHPTKHKLAISMQGEKSKTSIFNLDSNKRIALDSINDFGARAIGWNKTGKILAVGDYDGFLTFFDEDGKRIKKISTNQKSIIGLDWHPTKDLVVAVGDKISIYDFSTDAISPIEDRKEEVLMLCVAWHPSGNFFVTGDYGDFDKNHPPLLQFWSFEGKNIKRIKHSTSEFRDLKWSEDGTLLATASEKIRLWDKQGNLISEKSSPDLLWGVDWNKAGTKLITTDKKGSIVVWDKQLNKLNELKY